MQEGLAADPLLVFPAATCNGNRLTSHHLQEPPNFLHRYQFGYFIPSFLTIYFSQEFVIALHCDSIVLVVVKHRLSLRFYCFVMPHNFTACARPCCWCWSSSAEVGDCIESIVNTLRDVMWWMMAAARSSVVASARITIVYTVYADLRSLLTILPNLHLASSERRCWSGGREKY